MKILPKVIVSIVIYTLVLKLVGIVSAETFKLTSSSSIEYKEKELATYKMVGFPAEMKIYASRWCHKSSPADKYFLSKDGKSLNVTGRAVDKQDGDGMFRWDMDYVYLDGTNFVVKAVYNCEDSFPPNNFGGPTFTVKMDKAPKGAVVEIQYLDGSKKRVALEKEEIKESSFTVSRFLLQINNQFIMIEPGKANQLYVYDSRVGDSSAPTISVTCSRKNFSENLKKGEAVNFEMKFKTGFLGKP